MTSRSLSLSAAALTKRFHGEGSILDGPGKIKLAEEYHEFSMWIGTLTMASPKTKMMRRVGVAYAMLCTYQESKAKAKEFWKEVIEGTGANPQSGSRRLQIKLMQTLRGAGSGVSNQMDWFVIAGFCLSAWNSWKKGEDKLGNFRLTDIYKGKWAPHKTGKSKK
jgi:hypothetical protein